MTLFVDTSVWSLPFRRDHVASLPEVNALTEALRGGLPIVTTGLVLQELLQGFSGPRAQAELKRHFTSLPFVVPDRSDHVNAADLRNTCRRAGVQLGTVAALLAQLCIRHRLTMLTTDADFRVAARHIELDVWTSP